MAVKNLYVLATVRKKPKSKYEVVFRFSDQEKNFKRAKDCSTEIQEMAYYCSPDMLSRGIKGSFCYFDCNTKEYIIAPEKLTYEWLECKRMLVMDSLVFGRFDRSNVGLVLLNFVCKTDNCYDNAIGCYSVGKVFIKYGRKAKVEIETDGEMEKIYQIIENNLIKYIGK